MNACEWVNERPATKELENETLVQSIYSSELLVMTQRVTQEELGVEPLLYHLEMKRSQLKGFGHLFGTVPW